MEVAFGGWWETLTCGLLVVGTVEGAGGLGPVCVTRIWGRADGMKAPGREVVSAGFGGLVIGRAGFILFAFPPVSKLTPWAGVAVQSFAQADGRD